MPSRRIAIKTLGAAGAGLLLRLDSDASGQDLVVGGRAVELRIASVSARTVRISLLPRDSSVDALNADNALVELKGQRRLDAASSRVKVGELAIAWTLAMRIGREVP